VQNYSLTPRQREHEERNQSLDAERAGIEKRVEAEATRWESERLKEAPGNRPATPEL